MPAILNQETETAQENARDIEVLVTGFGAFKNYVENPSWLAVKSLHDTYLTTSQCPTMESFPRAQSATTSSESAPPRRIHLQTIQLAVAYQHLLDTVPRLHSTLPSSPHAKPWLDKNNDQDGSSGNGESYPNGYRVKHQNYDIILHVGVGLKGKLAVETTGHKRGYRLKDSTDLKCPAFRDQSGQDGIERIESDAEKMERLRLEVERDIDQVVRGFDEGYEAFEDLEAIEIDAVKLIDWLKNKGVPTRESQDAGRFLCDFLSYSSIVESKRSDPVKTKKVKTLFVHIPPIGEDLTTEQATEAIQAIVWFMACLDKSGL